MAMTRGNGNLAIGFEGGLLSTYGGASTAGSTIQSATKRTGTYALKIAHAADYQHYVIGGGGGVGNTFNARIYVYISTVPTAGDTHVFSITKGSGFDHGHGIGIRSDGAWHSFARANSGFGIGPIAWGAAGPAVVANSWVRLEVRARDDTAAAPDNHYTDAWVNDQLLDIATLSQDGGGPLQECTLGNAAFYSFASPQTFDCYYDDLVSFDSANPILPYPIGPGACFIQVPASEGTHVNSGSFLDSNASSPPTNPQLLVDEIPFLTNDTDWLEQNGGANTDYLEFLLTSVTTTRGTPQASTVGLGYTMTDGVDFVDQARFGVKTYDSAAATPVHNWRVGSVANIGGYPEGANQFSFSDTASLTFRNNAADHNWTIDELNALRLRVGYNDLFNSLVRYHVLWIETDIYIPDAQGIGSWQIVG